MDVSPPSSGAEPPPGRFARRLLLAVAAGLAMAEPVMAASEEPVRVELNVVESVQSRCRLSFVIENKGEGGIETLKLDLAVFGTDGAIQRRLVAEMGPVRKAKTVVRTFELEGECGKIGSILVNDVTACAPPDASVCLDRLELLSRLPAVRFFK